MKTNDTVDAFMMGLTDDEESIISYLTGKALNLSDDIREDVKWMLFAISKAIAPLSELCRTRNTLRWFSIGE